MNARRRPYADQRLLSILLMKSTFAVALLVVDGENTGLGSIDDLEMVLAVVVELARDVEFGDLIVLIAERVGLVGGPRQLLIRVVLTVCGESLAALRGVLDKQIIYFASDIFGEHQVLSLRLCVRV